MTVEFGILLPGGYSSTTVRVLRLDPRPRLFTKDLVVTGWGEPDRATTQNERDVFFYRSGSGGHLRPGRQGGDQPLLHRDAAEHLRRRRPEVREAPPASGTAGQAPRRCRRRRGPLRRHVPPRPPVIDHLLALDPGARRYRAASSSRAERRRPRAPSIAAAARLLTTGFALGPGLPETDGPPGTAVLGRALRQLGSEVIYVTDAVTVPRWRPLSRCSASPRTS